VILVISFIVRRILIAIPVLFLASVFTFFLVVNAGDPLENLRARPGVSPATIAQEEARLGLDKPFVERYTDWMSGVLRGDFGKDMKGRPVWPSLWSSIKYTLRLVLAAEILAFFVGLAIGVVSALRQYSKFDYTATFIAFLFFSLPTFWFANLLKVFGAIEFNDWLEAPGISWLFALALSLFIGGSFFAIGRARERMGLSRPGARYVWGGTALGVVGLVLVGAGLFLSDRSYSRWVKTIGSEPRSLPDTFIDRLGVYIGHAILPVIVLFTISFAGYSRYMRASMLEATGADHVRTARAKGLPERRVIMRHAFRNALIPIATVAALNWGALIGGAIVTERVFGWNGMGDFFLESLNNPSPDPNRLLAFVMITAIATITFNIIADIVYGVLDPRIRIG
jgi:peptide/nickel transport system permease protein